MSLSYLLFAGKYSIMTSYFSNAFLYFFLPASILGFLIMPKRAKKYFLLAASLIYFWLVSGKLIIYLLLSILAVHYFGLWLDRIQRKQSEAVKAAEKEEYLRIPYCNICMDLRPSKFQDIFPAICFPEYQKK